MLVPHKPLMPMPGVDSHPAGNAGTVAVSKDSRARIRLTGVALLEAGEGGPVPLLLLAVTVKVYAVPGVRPTTVIEAQGTAQGGPTMPPGLDVAV
jgi:hypothetical protein